MAKANDMIAYCGLYCRTCPAYTRSIAIAAKDLQKELRAGKCDKAAPGLAKIPGFGAFKHYGPFSDLLAILARMVCRKPCRAGGGSPLCKVRKCVKAKGFAGCWQCAGFATCTTLKGLEQAGDVDRTYLKNLRKIRRLGPAGFAKSQG